MRLELKTVVVNGMRMLAPVSKDIKGIAYALIGRGKYALQKNSSGYEARGKTARAAFMGDESEYQRFLEEEKYLEKEEKRKVPDDIVPGLSQIR